MSNENADNVFDLSEWDQAFNEAPDKIADEPPNDKYIVKVHKVSLDKTQKGDKRFNWQLKIDEGDYKGRMLFKNSVLSTVDSIKYLKMDLLRCGLKLTSINELPSKLGELLDLRLHVTKTARKDDPEKSNVWINKLAEAEAEQDIVPSHSDWVS